MESCSVSHTIYTARSFQVYRSLKLDGKQLSKNEISAVLAQVRERTRYRLLVDCICMLE